MALFWALGTLAVQVASVSSSPRPDHPERTLETTCAHTVNARPEDVYAAWTSRLGAWFAQPGTAEIYGGNTISESDGADLAVCLGFQRAVLRYRSAAANASVKRHAPLQLRWLGS